MLCLGLSGGLNLVHENPYEIPRVFTHDGAAAIVEDGKVARKDTYLDWPAVQQQLASAAPASATA